ncbi:putative NRPS-like enzyme [Seiridium unicorne]|uniref:NRPS-like enzyme n=1 Tax=Seiridium unicorne TaxID=138068 RepID=A0ABR2V4D7_9PEZI
MALDSFTPDQKRIYVITATTIGLILSTASTGARFFAKYHRRNRIQSEDWFITAGLLLSYGIAAAEFYGLSTGLGQHEEDISKAEKRSFMFIDRRKKWALAGIFTIGTFVVATSFLRWIALLGTSSDVTFFQAEAGIWTYMEAAMGITCANLPLLAPLALCCTQNRATIKSTERTSKSRSANNGSYFKNSQSQGFQRMGNDRSESEVELHAYDGHGITVDKKIELTSTSDRQKRDSLQEHYVQGDMISIAKDIRHLDHFSYRTLLRLRATDADQTPLLAFPKFKHVVDYEPISGAVLNHFVDGAARCLMAKGFHPIAKETVIGICAPTDLDYLVVIFGCMRLGYVPFLLSPRLAPSAVKALLESQGSDTLLFAPEDRLFRVGDKDLESFNLQPIPTRDAYDNFESKEILVDQYSIPDVLNKTSRRCMMLHSSGSTGLPKTIDIDDQKLIAVAAYAQDATAFITAPFSHSFGLLSYMQAFHKRRTIYAMSGHVPQTHDTLTAAIKAAKPDIVWTVPYALKLLTEGPDGVDALKQCRFVSSAGSKLPDEIGDMLTEAGVHIGMQFGSTETGLILSSAYRPQGDRAWNYLRPPPHVAPFVQFRSIGEWGGLHECIVLDGHKGKTASNSDDPPQSWHTNDLFTPHHIIPNAWKFIGRMDDRITLLNGEKVLPLSIEGCIRQHHLVREVVVFGIDREVPGLLLFRAPGTSHLTDDDFLEQVWPAIEDANRHSEGFAQISRECIAIIAEDVNCPTTDKSSIKRGQIYRDFAEVINEVYQSLENPVVGSLCLSVPELESWIAQAMGEMGHEIQDLDADFFSAGVDSLKAIQLRAKILKNIDLGDNVSQLTTTIVYDCGSPARLASRLYAIRKGVEEEEGKEEICLTKALIEENSAFRAFEDTSEAPSCSSSLNKVVLLTGTTGFLGAHLLAALVAAENVAKVYTIVRPQGQEYQSVLARVHDSLENRGLALSLEKVTVISADMTNPNFGLERPDFDSIRSNITHIIHCAWPVNFALPISSFSQHIRTLHELLQFSIESRQRPHLLFCSSIGVAQSIRHSAPVASEPIAELGNAAPTGYARSKLVGERIVQAAVEAGARASILRIGQITPGIRSGLTKLWNPDEAIPLMIRSSRSQSAGCLPVLGSARDRCNWTPVDVLAEVILDLAEISMPPGEGQKEKLVYNITNPWTFSWNDDLLPALREAGMEFSAVGWEMWLRELAQSSDDPMLNPSKKLLGFWLKQRADAEATTFDIGPTLLASPSMRRAPRLFDGQHIEQIVKAWMGAGAF